MSNWTHVAAIFRCDVLIDCEEHLNETLEESIERIFGKQFSDYPLCYEEMVDAEDNPHNYVPFGSEGGLTISVWENPDRHYMARYTVSVFGDLRDHDDLDLIRGWFARSCSKVGWLRQAVCTAHNEYYGIKTWTFDSHGDDDQDDRVR